MKRWIALTALLLLVFGFATNGAERPTSPNARSATTGPHGGQLHRLGDLQCEVVFIPQSVEVYVYDRDGHAVDVRQARGRITFGFQDDPRSYRHDLYPSAGPGNSTDGLYLAIDLSKIPDRHPTIDIALHGLRRLPVTFAASLRRKQMSAQVAIREQKICPISGKPLGSMGQPLKVRIRDRDVYLCCASCSNQLAANPEVHFAKLTWPLSKATSADAAAIARQRVCLVKGKPLHAAGGSWKTRLRGHQVFLCSRGCFAFLQSAPEKYLSKVPHARPASHRRNRTATAKTRKSSTIKR